MQAQWVTGEQQMLFILTFARLLTFSPINSPQTNWWSTDYRNGQWDGLKSGWTARLKGLWSAWNLAREKHAGILQRSVLGPVPSKYFINDLDDGIQCTLSKFPDDTQLGRAAHRPAACTGIQRDLEKPSHKPTGILWSPTKGNTKSCT